MKRLSFKSVDRKRELSVKVMPTEFKSSANDPEKNEEQKDKEMETDVVEKSTVIF